MTAKEKLTSLADAVREKTGETGPLSLDSMTSLIKELEVGGLPIGWATGEFKTTEETTNGDFIVTHGLSDIPNYVFIWSTAAAHVNGRWRMVMKVNMGKEYNEDFQRYEPTSVFSYGVKETATAFRASSCSEWDVDTVDYFIVPSQSTTVYPPDTTYKWVAICCPEM